MTDGFPFFGGPGGVPGGRSGWIDRCGFSYDRPFPDGSVTVWRHVWRWVDSVWTREDHAPIDVAPSHPVLPCPEGWAVREVAGMTGKWEAPCGGSLLRDRRAVAAIKASPAWTPARPGYTVGLTVNREATVWRGRLRVDRADGGGTQSVLLAVDTPIGRVYLRRTVRGEPLGNFGRYRCTIGGEIVTLHFD